MRFIFHRQNIILAACLLTLGACTSAPEASNAPEADQATDTAQATGSQATSTESAKVDPAELQKAVDQYKAYVVQETAQLVDKTQVFTDAVIAGDIKKAKEVYAPARVHWERTEPIAELFADLDGSMDAREDDFAKKAEDPAFTGFHRLEKALYKDNSTEGMKPIAEQLMKDTLTLQKRIDGLTIEPKNMVGGAAALIEEVAATKVTGEEDRYSRTDLWDFNANLEGSQKIVELLHPVLETADPALHTKIDKGFDGIEQVLSKYKAPDGGFVSYEKVSEADRKMLKPMLAAHAEDLSQLRGVLGVE
jgi:iron uptake system component EfeO